MVLCITLDLEYWCLEYLCRPTLGRWQLWMTKSSKRVPTCQVNSTPSQVRWKDCAKQHRIIQAIPHPVHTVQCNEIPILTPLPPHPSASLGLPVAWVWATGLYVGLSHLSHLYMNMLEKLHPRHQENKLRDGLSGHGLVGPVSLGPLPPCTCDLQAVSPSTNAPLQVHGLEANQTDLPIASATQATRSAKKNKFQNNLIFNLHSLI